MPRNQQQGTTLRNRNRVTNKTRLKIVRGNIDADPLILDEEEERARIIATSGVDAEDANEHHLQVAINAATQRHTQDSLKLSGSSSKDKKESYIPTPDAAGLVANYDKLYTLQHWEQPRTHLRFSDTIEDTVDYAVANGYTYFMDERDQDWLLRNNQEANGEGTSLHAINIGTTTRSTRMAKSKGKEPESAPAVTMSEDEFELIVGLLEKCTDERFPCLHVDASQIPSFSEYEQFFSAPLPAISFASFTVPGFATEPQRTAHWARAIFPYWRDRRLERGGRRIAPQLNDDESNDNDPYVCFRRRDSKPVRKTRASQTIITDRMIKLKSELTQCYTLALKVIQREEVKQSQARENQTVWFRRTKLLDLKRRYPFLSSRDDEELLLEKERSPKKHKPSERTLSVSTHISKSRLAESPLPQIEYRVWPKERYLKIQNEINDEMSKHRDKNILWEDVIDLSYHYPQILSSDRLFTKLDDEAEDAVASSDNHATSHSPHLRLRHGRGGRLHLDRVFSTRQHFEVEDTGDTMDDWNQRVEERWRFDPGSTQLVDADNRFLLDDHHPKYLRHAIGLLLEEDRGSLSAEIQTFALPGFFENSRSPVKSLPRRPGDDVYFPGQITQGQSIPPPTTVPSSVPFNHVAITDNLHKRNMLNTSLPGVPANGAIAHLTVAQSASTSHPVQAKNPTPANINPLGIEEGPQSEEAPNSMIAKPPANLRHMLPPANGSTLIEAPSYQTPLIARHRLQSHRPNMSQQNGLTNGHVGNGFQLHPALHSQEISEQQIQQLKQALNPPVLGPSNANFRSLSPSRPTSHVPSVLGINGHTSLENVNLAMGQPINLKLPPKIPRHSSPQQNSSDMLPGQITPHNVPAMLRSPTVNALQQSPLHRGSSPLGSMFTPAMAGRTSPHARLVASQSPQMHSLPHPSTTMTSPQRPLSSLSGAVHHQTVNGHGHSPAF